LNNGTGVRTGAGADLQFTRTDGTSFTVDVDGAATIQDVINKINDADTVNGTVTATVVASLTATGNGITLTDTAGGPGTLTVSSPNQSEAAADLGLAGGVASGTTLVGTDVNPVAAQGIFANLAKLRDSLKASDQTGITAAATGLQSDQDRVTQTRGTVGAQVQDLTARSNRLDDENLSTTSLLSNLQDTDFTEAISRFQTLQTALQASLESAGKTLNLSLMDFLG
jgi:flagellin-like hook-associated protein FlgL